MWWEEGMANFTGIAGAATNLKDYQGLFHYFYQTVISEPRIDTSADAISQHLLAHQMWQPPVGNPPGWQEAGYGYGIGALFVQDLTAINGLDPAMQVYKNMGSGMSFIDAFKLSYGFTFQDAVNVIAPIISTQIAYLASTP
jgi:hypothetical protein